ncbi:hypothetical protein VNI00_009721 [Paramarasmius palmivorus]|uniref:Lysine-specific metallo-endopeptidase domain-containing protein n=1 Tax=Paramarasmius palmivorus TaxID=297713 RepID=A0AAW0CN70_9AGAR
MSYTSSTQQSMIVILLLVVGAMAEKSLSLVLTGSKTSSSVVHAKLSNTGDEQLKLLNDPQSLLSRAPTDSFIFTLGNDDSSPFFNGMKFKYSPSYAAQNGDASSFTTLKPGDSIEVEHELASAYAFGPEEYLYGISAKNDYYHLDESTGQLENINAKVSSMSAKITVPDSRKARRSSPMDRRAQFSNCTNQEQAAIAKAVPSADIFANLSASALYPDQNLYNKTLLQFSTDGGPIYQTWFGQFAANRYKNATGHFTNITRHPFENYTYACNSEECTDTIFAYVFPDQFGTVNLCGAFWKAPLVGEDSQAGTLIHESTHFFAVAGTVDIVYGAKKAAQLAATNPLLALGNAG